MFRTARQRLVGWNVVVLTLILIFLGAAVYGFYRSSVYRQVDKELSGQRIRIVRYLYPNRSPLDLFQLGSPLEPDYRVIVADTSGRPQLSSDCPGALFMRCQEVDALAPTSKNGIRSALTPGVNQDIRTSTFRGQPQRVLTFFDPPWVFQVSRSVGPEQSSLNEIGRLMVFGGLAGIILSGFGSFFLASRAFVPIRAAFARQRKFTADASHELRTPLALIRANAEMVCRHGEQLPPGDAELVSEIIRETDHLSRLVSDLLTLARADSERAELNTTRVDLRALVSDVHEDLQRIAESRGIGTQINLNGPVVVEGDEVRLRQLVLILLDNALKYTDTGGHVDMALDREDGKARLLVSDTGVGIQPKDLPRIFDRFYRADQAREHESGGTGLGLAIAQWIVQAHHGSIKVSSEPGRGTNFVVELPARQEKPASA